MMQHFIYDCDYHYRVPDDEVVVTDDPKWPRHRGCGEQLFARPHAWEPIPYEYKGFTIYFPRTPELDAIEWGLTYLGQWAARFYRLPSPVFFTMSAGPHYVWYPPGKRGQLEYLYPAHVAISEGILALARWAQQWMKWPRLPVGEEGRLPWPHEDEEDRGENHRAARHPETGRYGSWATPASLSATACSMGKFDWLEKPRRTFLKHLVTCSECLTTFEANPEESTDWQPRPSDAEMNLLEERLRHLSECEKPSQILSENMSTQPTPNNGGR